MQKIDRYTKLTIGIILLGILLRFYLAINAHPAGDACWHLSIAQFIAENNKIPTFELLGRTAFSYPPVFYIISAFFYKLFSIFGDSAAQIGIKLVSPIFGSLFIWITFLIAKELYDKKIAFYSAVFISFLPLTVYMSSIAYLDSTFSFFIALSVYCMIKNRLILSVISLGLANNVRFYGIIILPLLFYLIYMNKKYKKIINKEFIKKIIMISILIVILSAPWFLRNYIELGNPIYPAFNSFFGVEKVLPSSAENFIHEKYLTRLYLELFGVPNGDWNNLFFINTPVIWIFIVLWLTGTLLFISPGCFYKKSEDCTKNWILLLWIGLILTFMLIIAIEVDAFSRHFLPAMPALAMVWGVGLNNLPIKFNKHKKWITLVLAILIFGFVAIELIKNHIASSYWERYTDDFAWVKQNTPKNAIFYATNQCLSFNLERFTSDNVTRTDYFWIQEKQNINGMRSMLDQKLPKLSRNISIKNIYENNRTKTEIYKIKNTNKLYEEK